jgi:hypothetical protein
MSNAKNARAKKNFSDSGIIFDSTACDCEIGSIPLSRDLKKYTVYLYPNGNSLSYGFKDGKELFNCADGSAVLPDLLAIRERNVDDVKSFIEKHGYFLPLIPNADNSIDSELLFVLINRLKATVSLMTAFAGSDKTPDYENIMALTMYLLLTPPVRINDPNGNPLFTTCPHIMGQVWNGIYQASESNRRIENEEHNAVERWILDEKTCGDSGCDIKDTIRPPHTWVSLSESQYIIDYYVADPSSVIGKILYFYQDTTAVGTHCRLAIDFLYHFCNDVGEIQTWNHKGELVVTKNNFKENKVTDIKPKESELIAVETDFTTHESEDMEDNPSTSILFNRRFDEQLREGLLKLAKHTLKTELEYNLKGVLPSYSTETLTPAWRVDYLLSGLYFSLFNMRAKEEVYRVCAKPNCGRQFFAKVSSIKNKYCSQKCANATAQNLYRHKNKV